jgi:hypothetical protein
MQARKLMLLPPFLLVTLSVMLLLLFSLLLVIEAGPSKRVKVRSGERTGLSVWEKEKAHFLKLILTYIIKCLIFAPNIHILITIFD